MNEFTLKYNDLLQTISAMPKDSTKSHGRMEYLKAHPGYDTFIVDLIKLIPNCLRDYSETSAYFKENPVAGLDGLTFYDSLEKSIGTFEYKKDGMAFYSWFEKIYKQSLNTRLAAEEFEQRFSRMNTTGCNKREETLIKQEAALLKLVRTAAKIYENRGETGTIEEIIEYMIASKGQDGGILKNTSARQIKIAVELYMINKGFSDSTDRLLNDEDTLGETLGSLDNHYVEVTDKASGSVAITIIVENWWRISEAFGKRSEDIFKAFFSRILLDELKRYPVKKIKPDGTVDIDRVAYEEEPAGDLDFFEYLLPNRSALENKILHRIYTNSAFDIAPDNDLQKIYYRLLKKGFLFSDLEIAKALGKGKSDISKKKKNFKNAVDKIIEIFLENDYSC